MVQKKTEYGSGPLFKAAGTVYGVMVGDLLLVLANVLLVLAPLVIALMGSSGLGGAGILVGLIALVPVGPSLAAAMYAFNRLLAGHDTGVFRDFVRAYRATFRQALIVWLPYLTVLAVIAFNLLALPGGVDLTYPVSGAARLGLLGLGLMVATTAVTALLLLSRFTFRTRDVYRLSLYCLGVQKRVSLGNAGILFVATFLLLATTASLMLFIAGAVVYLVCLNSRTLLKFVEGKFTVHNLAVPNLAMPAE